MANKSFEVEYAYPNIQPEDKHFLSDFIIHPLELTESHSQKFQDAAMCQNEKPRCVWILDENEKHADLIRLYFQREQGDLITGDKPNPHRFYSHWTCKLGQGGKPTQTWALTGGAWVELEENCYVLKWMWIHPYIRGYYAATQFCASFMAINGPLYLYPPVSKGMQKAFLKAMEAFKDHAEFRKKIIDFFVENIGLPRERIEKLEKDDLCRLIQTPSVKRNESIPLSLAFHLTFEIILQFKEHKDLKESILKDEKFQKMAKEMIEYRKKMEKYGVS